MLRRSIPAIPTIDPGPQDSAAPAPSDLCEVRTSAGDPAATPNAVVEPAQTMLATL